MFRSSRIRRYDLHGIERQRIDLRLASFRNRDDSMRRCNSNSHSCSDCGFLALEKKLRRLHRLAFQRIRNRFTNFSANSKLHLAFDNDEDTQKIRLCLTLYNGF
ncbi:hypothetical protein NPIL_290701 [Nephila pilipes]|uniref:Uncharacterized protein n=1 Tax=Nephila pilipes TaxID=299642 RepID=A0A8X6QS84_NEPPI|nr:hypothetical protein NPIL_290701 [Nephila pilipes]